MNLGDALSQDNRIRIITNAGIRYEGRLYAINPQERTIAL
jgi:Scd6-like Sm domain